ncbi:MAG: electron transfer flavoprotein subunit alpha/FixB family protein, partial [Trebonia sp.]
EPAAAPVVVCGGRGTGSAAGFAMLERLARLLGGAVAASGAAVDYGWHPASGKVGQTGITVSPKLYIAAGVSGASQHRAGMRRSRITVAVNKDPGAPIFGFADFGVVGDLFLVLPQLIAELEKRSGEPAR